ncbi:hypothetical protein [uncultured Thiodictyon sp.]|uniref:hypothetical protein n=1 Tax=uncultured Thiodictyon sp. TaxID=1846217 RepID=UPI0025CD7827|nr:hypothetical protein [uncultured Thiodictyon sp.]
MNPTAAARVKGRIQSLWERIPRTWWEVLLLWAASLALGTFAFWTIRNLPFPAVLACWATAAGLGLLFVGRTEPILWEAPAPAPEPELLPNPIPPPAATRGSPLLDLVPIPGGTFRMGSPPATQAQIAEFVRHSGMVQSGGR